jgi:hypothetical protein
VAKDEPQVVLHYLTQGSKVIEAKATVVAAAMTDAEFREIDERNERRRTFEAEGCSEYGCHIYTAHVRGEIPSITERGQSAIDDIDALLDEVERLRTGDTYAPHLSSCSCDKHTRESEGQE